MHRQKRQRLKAEPLATARFLPSAAPEQLRVWRWSDLLLLLARCLLLLALIAWLAVTVFPWRGDTVLVDAGVDQAWARQQIDSAGFGAAARVTMAAAMEAAMEADILPWLHSHEHEWRGDARLLIVADGAKVAMPARLPQFAHALTLRIKAPLPKAAVANTEHRIALATTPERAAAWHALFAAFNLAGGATQRYVVADAPDGKTELIVWDLPGSAPPPAWRAPLWWTAPDALPELAAAPSLSVNGLTLKYAATARGRVWASSAWPAQDGDGARAIYETWQLLAHAAPAYPASSQVLDAGRAAMPGAAPAAWLAWLLLALFSLERILTHARRH
ncbi:hypothetical protein [Rugamonas sp.]|uniref:hypothetical protein n=1 Tax=Rugamonas sp. TaxID=1926287 RepID=UPI0025E7EDF6|nr:hypothetical protein [Rugamonas sp.]